MPRLHLNFELQVTVVTPIRAQHIFYFYTAGSRIGIIGPRKYLPTKWCFARCYFVLPRLVDCGLEYGLTLFSAAVAWVVVEYSLDPSVRVQRYTFRRWSEGTRREESAFHSTKMNVCVCGQLLRTNFCQKYFSRKQKMSWPAILAMQASHVSVTGVWWLAELGEW